MRRLHDPDRVFAFIVQYKRSHDGNSPTIQEICEECGISSKSVCQRILRKLAAHGKLKPHRKGKPRAVETVGGKWTYSDTQ